MNLWTILIISALACFLILFLIGRKAWVDGKNEVKDRYYSKKP